MVIIKLSRETVYNIQISEREHQILIEVFYDWLDSEKEDRKIYSEVKKLKDEIQRL